MRQATSRMLLMMTVLSAPSAWAAPTLSLVASPYQSPGAGNHVVVAAAGTQMDGVTSADLSYAYDPSVMTPTGVFLTGFTSGSSVTSSFATPGVVNIHLSRASALVGSGDVAWVTFKVLPGTPAGSTSPLSWVATSLNGGTLTAVEQGATLAIASAPATVAMSASAYAAHGAQIQLPISAISLSGGSSFDLAVAFDPTVLSAVSVQKTSFSSCMSMVANTATPGTVRISLYGLCTLTGSGPLAMVTFNVIGANGNRTPLNVTRASIDEDRFPSALEDGLFNACATPDLDGDGYSACAGDCNDANASVHPGAVETCDGIDDDCDGVADDAMAPRSLPTLRVDNEFEDAYLSWTPSADATAYDVMRGDLGSLRSHAGDFSQSADFCLGFRVTTDYVIDGPLPEAGSAFWYLLRPRNCGGAGSYDEGSGSQARPRDASVNASPYHCR